MIVRTQEMQTSSEAKMTSDWKKRLEELESEWGLLIKQKDSEISKLTNDLSAGQTTLLEVRLILSPLYMRPRV